MGFICRKNCDELDNTYFWTRLEDVSIWCTSKELISSLSAVDDDDPSIGQANFEHGSVDLVLYMVCAGPGPSWKRLPTMSHPLDSRRSGSGVGGVTDQAIKPTMAARITPVTK